MLMSFNFLNSAKVCFRISIGGYAESKRSPAISTKSSFSRIMISIIFWKDLKFRSWSSCCLQLPK